MARKESEKICMQCSKIIDTEKDKYVLLGTFNRLSMPDELCYFHYSCWADYFMKKVHDRAKLQVQGMQSMARKMMDHPMIKSALLQVQGGDQIVQAINYDLDQKVDFNKEEAKKDLLKNIEKKIKDGKEKKRKN